MVIGNIHFLYTIRYKSLSKKIQRLWDSCRNSGSDCMLRALKSHIFKHGLCFNHAHESSYTKLLLILVLQRTSNPWAAVGGIKPCQSG